MLLLVGGYTIDMDENTPGKARGLAAYDFDTRNGDLMFRGFTPAVNPSYLWVDQHRNLVYVVCECSESNDPGLLAYHIRRDKQGKVVFEKVSEAVLKGDHPCHVTGVENTLIVCCYTSGTVHVFAKDKNGYLGPELQRIDLLKVGSDRQPHAHCATYDSVRNRVYVCDLGSDRLRVFQRLDDGTLQLLPDHGVSFPEGHGPRHIALHPGGDFAVLICELHGVTTLIDLRRDKPAVILTSPYLPERVTSEASGAAIRLDKMGKNVYLSDRNFSLITHMRLDVRSDRYVNRDSYPSGGQRPRDLSLSPDGQWLLAGNLKSHSISVFRTAAGGALTLYKVVQKVPSPTCLKWLDV